VRLQSLRPVVRTEDYAGDNDEVEGQ
jgi:hypothetical protein